MSDQSSAAMAVGKTVKSVVCNSSWEGCCEVQLRFTDGTELKIEGGFYDGTLRVGYAIGSPAAAGNPTSHEADCALNSGRACSCPMGNL